MFWLRLLGAALLVGAVLSLPDVGEPAILVDGADAVEEWTRAILLAEGCDVGTASNGRYRELHFQCGTVYCLERFFFRDEQLAYRLQCSRPGLLGAALGVAP